MLRLVMVFSLIPMFAIGGDPVLQRMPAKEFQKQMEQEPGKVLDVRKPDEYAEGHVAGATLMNFYDDDFKQRLGALDKVQTYYIYCRSGGRSGKTLEMMRGMGFQRVYEMSNGFMGWSAANLPVAKD